MNNFLRTLWHAWQRLGQIMADVVVRVILSVFYFSVLIPFAIGIRLSQDPLGTKTHAQLGWWCAREPAADNLDLARRQY
jgi:hypothetical protein